MTFAVVRGHTLPRPIACSHGHARAFALLIKPSRAPIRSPNTRQTCAPPRSGPLFFSAFLLPKSEREQPRSPSNKRPPCAGADLDLEALCVGASLHLLIIIYPPSSTHPHARAGAIAIVFAFVLTGSHTRTWTRIARFAERAKALPRSSPAYGDWLPCTHMNCQLGEPISVPCMCAPCTRAGWQWADPAGSDASRRIQEDQLSAAGCVGRRRHG
ncbi:hypothetical protein C8Q80DRAFT_163664 [Daedaleopsis nitida]|nr:hypothetical protein C8Q80DRAFT_163664 [Daedaleopsis nitida]